MRTNRTELLKGLALLKYLFVRTGDETYCEAVIAFMKTNYLSLSDYEDCDKFITNELIETAEMIDPDSVI